MTWAKRQGPHNDPFQTHGGITPRTCPWDGSTTVITKEGLLKCLFCLRRFQTGGFNYRILEQR